MLQTGPNFFVMTGKFLQQATKIGSGTLWDDAKIVVPIFFIIGMSIEMFMIKTGFCM